MKRRLYVLAPFILQTWAASALAANAVVNIKTNGGLCLDDLGWSTALAAPIGQFTCNGYQNQKFDATVAANGNLILANQFSGQCMDVNGASSADGAPLIQFNCSGGANQSFRAVARSSGKYQIVAVHSGKCLGVSNINNGTQPTQSTCNGSAGQDFSIQVLSGSLPLTVPSPTTSPSPVLAANLLNVQSPAQNATVSGTVQIKGQAGSQWLTVAGFDASDTSIKVASDVKPAGGAFALSLDTTKLPNGQKKVALIAFSVASGQSGGTRVQFDLSLNVQNGVTLPNPSPTVAASGMIVGACAYVTNDFKRIAATGIKALRMDHPDASTIELARTFGIEVLPIADYGYSDLSATGNWLAPPTQANLATWARRMVDTYRNMKNPPKVIEVWNEPWNSGFWDNKTPDAAFYLEIVKAFAKEAWAQWPTVKLLVSADQQGIGYRTKLLAADKTGILRDPRVLPTTHNYVEGRTPTQKTGTPCDWDLDRYECAYQDFKAHGHPDPQVWITEFGWETVTPAPSIAYYGTVTEQTQADYTIQALEIFRKSGHVAAAYGFMYRTGENWAYNWLRPDNSDKPVVGAIKAYLSTQR
jgi:hypothetical protein